MKYSIVTVDSSARRFSFSKDLPPKKTIVPIADSAYIPVHNSVFIINS